MLIIPVENMEMFNIKIPIKNKNKNDIILLILLVLNAPILPANIQIKVIIIKNIDIFSINKSFNFRNIKIPTGKYKNHITAFDENSPLFISFIYGPCKGNKKKYR
ncbi:MAG: hypothetical protein KKG62_02965 [Actinobacteria bacterium]|nr:hypothetical protein [Actinomycetota bacterium]